MNMNYDIEHYLNKQDALEARMIKIVDKLKKTDRDRKEIRKINDQIDKIGVIILKKFGVNDV